MEGGTPEAALARAGTLDLLVVLDNCEHLIEAAAGVAEAITSRGGEARVLATSRESLGIAGEHVWTVAPLALSGEDPPARRLFVERARAATLPLPELVERLDDLDALRLSRRGGEARHRTLTAVVEWSEALLDEADRELLAELSTFAWAVGEADVAAVTGRAGALARRHAEHVADVVIAADRDLRSAAEGAAAARLDGLIDDLRAAYRWARSRPAGRRAALGGAAPVRPVAPAGRAAVVGRRPGRRTRRGTGKRRGAGFGGATGDQHGRPAPGADPGRAGSGHRPVPRRSLLGPGGPLRRPPLRRAARGERAGRTAGAGGGGGGLVGLLVRIGSAREAAQLLGAVEKDAVAPTFGEEAARLAAARTWVTESLGHGEAQRRLAAGAALSLDDVALLALTWLSGGP